MTLGASLAVPVEGKVRHRFAFVFPLASGHINPSLPVSRSLVEAGHEVHYVCREQMREAIEGTGAALHLDTEIETELFEGRDADIFGALGSLKREHGLENEGGMVTRMKLRNVALEL